MQAQIRLENCSSDSYLDGKVTVKGNSLIDSTYLKGARRKDHS